MKRPPINPFPSARATRAFSLMELLIAVTITAVVAGLLLGVYPVAAAIGANGKCVSNLRSIGSAVAGYLADHNGVLPPMSALKNPTEPSSAVINGQEALAPYLGMPDDFKWNQNTLSPSPFGVWICPADKELRPSKVQPALPRWKAQNSYLINYYIGKSVVTETGGNKNQRTVLRFTQVRNLDEVWYFADGIRPDGGQGRLTEGVISAADTPAGDFALRFRHQNHLNALRLSGSVVSFAPADVRGMGLRFAVPNQN